MAWRLLSSQRQRRISVQLLAADAPVDVSRVDSASASWLVLVQDARIEALYLPRGHPEDEVRDQWISGRRRLADRVAAAEAVGRSEAWPMAHADREPVSVVIPTKDRPTQLRRGLIAAKTAMCPGDQLIVVDNGRLGASRRVAEECGATCVHEPRPGVAFARNRGAAEASNEIVVFLDDDGMADRVLIDALVAPLMAEQAVVATTGGVLGRDTTSLVGELFDARYPLFRGWQERRFAGGTGSRFSPFDIWQVGPGAAMAWRRSVFEAHGGFDPALGEGTPAGGVEDSDLFRRVLERGQTIVYTPLAVLWHDHPATRRELRRKMNHYTITGGAHATKIAVETGRMGAARLAVRQLGWLPRWLAIEAVQSVQGRPSLPLWGIAPYPIMTVVGALRFLRHRARLRALADPADPSGSSPAT